MLWSSEDSFFEHVTRTQCAFSIAVLTLVYSIVVIIYNIFLHPLARFPGPIHYRASILPWAYETFRGTLTFTVLGLHERYGPVVRISPSELCFSDPQAWRDIYGTTVGQENPKYRGVYGSLSGHMAESILAAGQEKHKVMRGILAEGFCNRARRGQERLIMGHVDVMMQQLRNVYRQENYEVNGNMGKEFNAKRAVIDVNEWFYWITSDIISYLSLGESFHCLENLQTHPYLRFLSIVPEWLLKSVVLRHLGMGTIIEIVTLTFASKLSQMLEGMKERLEKRIESTDKRGDPIELMVAAKEAGQLTFEHVLGTANFLILAGSETTSITLTAFIYFMVTNSIHLTRVADEVLLAFKSEDEINLSRAEKLQYLNACLKETLRVFPAIAGGAPRVVARGGGAIAGNYIPQDVSIAVPIPPGNWT
ncbi:hypothetical protein VE02_05868 [Pseudogymnoascus sp. 03VT05]|nr:hypothetical protein VE02_05868 [Pseudogymnoascus sp. 03VT05]